jgi:hypothetical protein
MISYLFLSSFYILYKLRFPYALKLFDLIMKENILVKSSKNFMTIMELDIRLHAHILLKKRIELLCIKIDTY